MKKLLFATALVASAAAFADPTTFNWIGFEGYDANDTFANGAAEKGEDGNDKSVGPFFYYDGDQDGSSVKAFGGENAAAPSITRPAYFGTTTPNANYLELSTEGGILWRSINDISNETVGETTTYGLGTAQAVAADGIYLDTLVQFTPTEDGGAPELDAADKLAIWLNVDGNGVTNLMVRAGWVDDAGALGATNFVLSGKTVVAGTWYRLTVKALPDILQANEELKYPAFMVYIDGTEMSTGSSTIDSAFVTESLGELFLDGMASKVASGSIFVSLVAGDTSANTTLQGVGFKGSGALDDIVWTTEDPFQGGAGGSDYVVEIGGSDVVITPQEGDLQALQAAIVAGGGTLDVTDVAAVNAALAAPIPGTSPAIPSWQALFLGVAPTTNGLEQVAIESITIENGTVTVAMSDDLTLMTGRGVDIVLKVIGSNDLSTWNTETPLVTATNTLTIPAITPALGETKKFYKVVVEFAATPAQQN